jgi:hypothetical protein
VIGAGQLNDDGSISGGEPGALQIVQRVQGVNVLPGAKAGA